MDYFGVFMLGMIVGWFVLIVLAFAVAKSRDKQR